MKTKLSVIICAALALTALHLPAQPGPRGGGQGMGGPGLKFSPGFYKLFGEHKAWTAGIEIQMINPVAGGKILMPGKIAMLDGKSRVDRDLTKMQGGGMPPGAAEQAKAFGMAEMANITRPDKKAIYMVYTGLEAYLEKPLPEESDVTEDKYKLEITEQGKETIDNHPCVKSKFVITDSQGKKQEGMVWKATDMKNFPLRVQVQDQGQNVTMDFKDVKLTAPAATLFEPPAKFKRYDSQQAMMQEVMMKRFGAGAGGPPVPPTPK